MSREKSGLFSHRKRGQVVSVPEFVSADQLQRPRSSRWVYSFGGLLLLMSVAAVGAMLAGYALALPDVRKEVDLWLGRAAPTAEVGDSLRQAHLTFLLLCYAAPSALMIGMRVCQVFARRFADNQLAAKVEDEAFRMT